MNLSLSAGTFWGWQWIGHQRDVCEPTERTLYVKLRQYSFACRNLTRPSSQTPALVFHGETAVSLLVCFPHKVKLMAESRNGLLRAACVPSSYTDLSLCRRRLLCSGHFQSKNSHILNGTLQNTLGRLLPHLITPLALTSSSGPRCLSFGISVLNLLPSIYYRRGKRSCEPAIGVHAHSE